jgi:hypothetical protein
MQAREAVGLHGPAHVFETPAFEDAAENVVGVLLDLELREVDVPKQPVHRFGRRHSVDANTMRGRPPRTRQACTDRVAPDVGDRRALPMNAASHVSARLLRRVLRRRRETRVAMQRAVLPGGLIMLFTIAIVLLVMWGLGLVSSYTMGGFIHLLLVAAIVLALVQLVSGRRVV